MSKDGNYWNVNSAGIFRKKYSRRKQEVFTRPAFEPDTNTNTSGVDSGKTKGVTTPAGNSPQTSDIKDTTISPTTNELGENNDVSSVQEQLDGFEGYSREEDSNKT